MQRWGLFVSSHANATQLKTDARWISNAKKYLQQAERNLRLTSHLIEGQFYQEAIPAIRQALEQNIRAFAWLKGEGERTEDALTLTDLQDRLVKIHGLPQQALSFFKDFQDPQETTSTQQIQNWMTVTQDLFQHVDKTLNNRLLSTAVPSQKICNTPKGVPV